MEIKPFVGKIARYLFIGVISVSLWSCGTSKIAIDVLRMPAAKFTHPVQKIALINRVGLEYANTKQYVNGRVVAQYNGITDIMVNESITQMEIDLNADNFVTAFDTTLKYLPKIGRFDRGGSRAKLFNKNQIIKVCKALKTDAIVMIEGYDAEVDSDSDVQYSTPVDRNYGTVRVPYFTGDQSVLMQMLFRTYECANGGILDETTMANQVSISASGSTPYDVNVNMADANNILVQAARNLGTDYAKELVPTWDTQNRTIYITGNDQLKEAYQLAKGGNWPAATDSWYLLATSNNEKIAKRASYNLILASEIAGDLDLAEEWARRCINKYKMKEAETYLGIIKNRKAEIEKLQEIYPLMRNLE